MAFVVEKKIIISSSFAASFSIFYLPKRRLDRFLQELARVWRGGCVRRRGRRRGGRHKTAPGAFVFGAMMRSIESEKRSISRLASRCLLASL